MSVRRWMVYALAMAVLLETDRVEAYAEVGAATLTPMDYLSSLLSQACGVDFGPVGTTVAMFGQYEALRQEAIENGADLTTKEGYETYRAGLREKAEKGELGSFMKWKAEAEGETWTDVFDTVESWWDLKWGDTASIAVEGQAMDRGLFRSLKGWLGTFESYGTDEKDYTITEKLECIEYADGTIYPNLSFYLLNSNGGGYLVQPYAQEDDIYMLFIADVSSTGGLWGNFTAVSLSPFSCAYIGVHEKLNLMEGSKVTFKRGDASYEYYRYSMTWSGFGYGDERLPYYYYPVEIGLDPLCQKLIMDISEGVVKSTGRSVISAESVNKELQNTELKQNGVTVELPSSEEEAKEALEGINMGDSVDNILKALGALGLGLEWGMDVPEETEKPTTGETDAADETEEGAWEKQVVIRLEAILAGVEAIPKAIEGFFTLDLEQISAAFKGLLSTFQGKFDLVYKLAHIFRDVNRTFTDTPPVFRMQTPDCLKFAIEEEYITVLDLTTYKDVFFWVRGILAASIWFSFGKWLLDQFDVKFHIG